MSDRTLYLAIPNDIYEEFSSEPLVKKVFSKNKIKLILYESDIQKIRSWKS